MHARHANTIHHYIRLFGHLLLNTGRIRTLESENSLILSLSDQVGLSALCDFTPVAVGHTEIKNGEQTATEISEACKW